MSIINPMWLIGVGFSLESMRRGYIGGSSLSLFIIKQFGLEGQAIPTLNFLRGYLIQEQYLIDSLSPPLDFLAFPFKDFHLAASTFLKIVDILAEAQAPTTCELYWKE